MDNAEGVLIDELFELLVVFDIWRLLKPFCCNQIEVLSGTRTIRFFMVIPEVETWAVTVVEVTVTMTVGDDVDEGTVVNRVLV